MGEKEEVIIKIFGNEFCLKGDNKEYIHKLAQYVDDKIREVDKTTALGSSTKVAIYAAFQIADKMFRQEAETKDTEDKVNRKTSKMVKMLQEIIKQ